MQTGSRVPEASRKNLRVVQYPLCQVQVLGCQKCRQENKNVQLSPQHWANWCCRLQEPQLTLCTRGGKMGLKTSNEKSQKNEYSSRGIPWDEVFYLCLYWVPAVKRIAPIWQHHVGLHVSLAVKVFRKSFVFGFFFLFLLFSAHFVSAALVNFI